VLECRGSRSGGRCLISPKSNWGTGDYSVFNDLASNFWFTASKIAGKFLQQFVSPCLQTTVSASFEGMAGKAVDLQ
jgi:hypothetical protein